jgi:NADPH-dependent 2,4-dienoyl-CoA reductase/sulfur reductase-like enzyme/nitrite reductase/ring-hydroxylating ferredoxin subunit
VGEATAASGPDFAQGVDLADIPEHGPLAGRVGEEPVLLSRIDGDLHAVSGACTHYGAALAKGLAVGTTIRCPWHHACFDLRTGAALHAPAFAPLDRWEVEVEDGRAFVRRRIEAAAAAPARRAGDVRSVVIVGGGAAGFACAEQLRRLGYDGRLTMLSADADPPCDRPNLSKDYLAGTAPAEWIPLRDPDWYRDAGIDLRLDADVAAIDPAGRTATTRGGETFRYDRLLIAMGSDPVRLAESGFASDRVHVLRSLADARALVAAAQPGARVAILGSSFIGLEAAASFRARGLEVAIVSPDSVPFEKAFGRDVGLFFQALHAREGVTFHLGRTAGGFDDGTLRLDDGREIAADFVLAGIGVRPRTALAAAAGLAVSSGIEVDAFLEASLAGVYAAGDVASYPDPLSGRRLRIEHWVVAERQGQVAAANMLGARRRFDAVPFFWTEQYGTSLRYVGHAAGWDEVRVEGSIESGAFIARYYEGGALRASAAVGMDRASLEDELELERMTAGARPPAPAIPSPIGRGLG